MYCHNCNVLITDPLDVFYDQYDTSGSMPMCYDCAPPFWYEMDTVRLLDDYEELHREDE